MTGEAIQLKNNKNKLWKCYTMTRSHYHVNFVKNMKLNLLIIFLKDFEDMLTVDLT